LKGIEDIEALDIWLNILVWWGAKNIFIEDFWKLCLISVIFIIIWKIEKSTCPNFVKRIAKFA